MLAIALLISFAIAILSGLGIGGGGLLVIYLAFFTELPQLQIQGINLSFFLLCASASVIVHVRKRKLFKGIILIMSTAGIIGTILGCFAAKVISPHILRKIFGVLLVASGMLTFKNTFKKSTKKSDNNDF